MSASNRDPRAAVTAFVEKAHAALGSTDYYAVLGVSRDATASQMRDRYYRMASRLHPDLHGEWMAPELRDKLTAVYSRVVEAYRVLTDDERRNVYDAGLAEGKLRWDADAAARPKVKRDEDDVPQGAARRFFLLGRDALLANNAKSAVMNLRMALSMDPANEAIKRVLAKAEALERGEGGA